MADMGINVLKSNLTNPARTYTWDVLIPNPVVGDSGRFTARCRSTSIPTRSVGQIVLPYKQTPGVVYPGKLTVSHTWNLVFVDGEDRLILKDLIAWNDKVVNMTTGKSEGNRTDIATDVYLDLQNTKGDSDMKIKLESAYVQEIGEVTLDYDSENVILINTVIAFDSWVEA